MMIPFHSLILIFQETGLFRLLGHSAPISDVSFVPRGAEFQSFSGLVTSSFDGLVKVWDLDAQCCVQTIANHGGQVMCSTTLALPLDNEGTEVAVDESSSVARCRLVTGCIDGKVRIYSISKSKRMAVEQSMGDTETGNEDNNIDGEADDVCFFMGILPPPVNVATSKEKIVALQFHPSGKYFGYIRSNTKVIEIYAVRSEAETLAKKKRRLRRRREKENKAKKSEPKKSKKRGLLDDDEEDEGQQQDDKSETIKDLDEIQASDEFEYITTIRASHKIKAFKFAPSIEKKGGIRVVCALGTNALEVHSIAMGTNEEQQSYVTNVVSSMDMYGHPTGIRSIALSSDDVLACTVSKNVAKVWNVGSRSCLRSLTLATPSSAKKQGSYGLCSVFLPGDTHVVIGTREGYLLIVDIASGDIVFTEKAHEKEVWSIDIKRPTGYNDDERITLVTGSADKMVKFWDVESQDDSEDDESKSENSGHPMVVHTRTLESSDDVIAVRYSHSHEKRMVFVSTLDCQIKVFFDDSLRFFLSLYGHTLPALTLDASDDDTILASAGADKTIKIWGLDFGDTHRTLYGHSDSITDLKFVKKTHYFFTASKDGTIRYWDGDRFEQILLLNGHISEINCLAISRTGAFVLSAAMDRQVRVWERTKDMVFLEEEKERAMEDMFDKVDSQKDEEGTERAIRRRTNEEGQEEDDDNEPQSEAAVKRSVLSVASGDRIMEALERADEEIKDSAIFRKSQENKGAYGKKRMPNPYLLGMEPPQYILWVLRSVKSAEIEQSLLVLPMDHMARLIYYLIVLLRNGQGVELCSRAAIFLIKTHQNQLVGQDKMLVPLRELRRLLKLRLAEARDTIGYNLAAIRIINKVSTEHKNRYHIPDDEFKKDVFKDLGLGSDVAAAMQKKK